MNDNLAKSYQDHLVDEAGSSSRGNLPSSTRRARVPRLLALLVLGALALALLAQGVDYLADMPRERAQRNYTYAQRVWHGATMLAEMTWLRWQAAQDPYPQTKLPVAELRIDSSKLSALNENLPTSGREPQLANLRIGEREMPVEARYTGISINHWGMPWKSWNFKIQGEGDFLGLKVFNLMMPRSITQFENWLGNEMSRRMNAVITPHSEFVHFRLNGKLNGMRILEEPATPVMIARMGLPPGKLYHGDISTAQIYDGVPRPRLFSTPSAWRVQSSIPDNQGHGEMEELVRIIQTVHNPYDFFYQLPRVVNAESLTKYMALLEIISSVHIDETHNWKMYFNPETGLLEPIIWNSVAYYWRSTKSMDLAPNDLFRVVLANPELREDKDRAIWNAIQGELNEDKLRSLILAEKARISPDVYASELKWAAGDRGINLLSNEEWDGAMEDLLQVIAQRHAYLRGELSTAEVRYRLNSASGSAESSQLALQVGSRSGVRLEAVTLEFPRSIVGQTVRLERRGVQDIERPSGSDFNIVPESYIQSVVQSDGTATFFLDDTLTSKRRAARRAPVQIVPSTYVYLVRASAPAQGVGSILGKNSITGEMALSSEDKSIAIPEDHVPNIVWWSPRRFAAK